MITDLHAIDISCNLHLIDRTVCLIARHCSSNFVILLGNGALREKSIVMQFQAKE